MEENEVSEEKNKQRSLLFRILFAKIRIPFDLIILIIGISVSATVYTMVKVPQLSVYINPQINVQNETSGLVEAVSKLISLPDAEKPLVITVSNSETLHDQPFFEKAQEGDKMLLYTKSHKAILYRPDDNLIIEVGNVSIDR